MTDRIMYIDESRFKHEVLDAERVVVDFYSTECPPCEALGSKFESLSTLYGGDVKFVKIFRQENRALAEKLDVTSSPTLLFYRNGERTGDTLSGGIRRADIVRNLNSLLNERRVTEIESAVKKVNTDVDVVIMGGGPAGLTAGIYAAQALHRTMVIDTRLPGGWVSTSHQVSNYPGFSEPVQGFMLSHHMFAQAKAAGVEFRPAVDVTALSLEEKRIVIDGIETVRAKKIIVATGSSPKQLGVKGERDYKGKGISYCATCDAKYYEGKHVVVIGGGNSAIEESLFITRFAEKLTVIHQFAELQANRMLQERAEANKKISFIFEHEPREFKRNGTGVDEVVIEDLRTGKRRSISCDGVFIFAGMRPNLDLFEGMFELDEFGYVVTDDHMRTSIPDVFVAGDLRSKSFRQITTAVADGTIAAITAGRELERTAAA